MCKEHTSFNTDTAKFLTGYFARLGPLVMGTAGSLVPVLDPRCRVVTPATTGMAETWETRIENHVLDHHETMTTSATEAEMEGIKMDETVLTGSWLFTVKPFTLKVIFYSMVVWCTLDHSNILIESSIYICGQVNSSVIIFFFFSLFKLN